jgi:hypothetical protein
VGLRYAGPSYETQSRLPGSALKKVPDSSAHDDHEDHDYEPSIHLLPPTSLTALRQMTRSSAVMIYDAGLRYDCSSTPSLPNQSRPIGPP